MKFSISTLVPLAAVTSAFVVPSEQVLGDLAIDDHHHDTSVEEWNSNSFSLTKDKLLSSFEKQLDELAKTSQDAWDELSRVAENSVDSVVSDVKDAAQSLDHKWEHAFGDVENWLEENSILASFEENDFDDLHHPGKRPHHPHKRPHHHKPNETVYELIAGSKYTTKLAKWIAEYPDLVEALNSTDANFTIFAPTDKAFEKIPEKAPKPSKEVLKKILAYHVVPDVYPAGRVLASHTLPTLLKGEHLASEAEPQRLAFKVGLRGLTINYRSRIVAIDIFGTNGVIHAIDNIILPPPKALTIIDLFPGAYSTLELGLTKTGLLDELKASAQPGGTLFAPSNWAFQKLGPKINAFLFSKYGVKYLKALLEYHIVPGTTLYSDAIYHAKTSDVEAMEDLPKKGHFRVELPTLLKNRDLTIDVARLGGLISIKINAFTTVAVADTIAQDGVIHSLRKVLIPPKKIGNADVEHWDGSELTVEEFKERLEPYVAKEYL